MDVELMVVCVVPGPGNPHFASAFSAQGPVIRIARVWIKRSQLPADGMPSKMVWKNIRGNLDDRKPVEFLRFLILPGETL